MKLRVSTLAAAACLLANPAYALTEQDIPTDKPVSALLSSAQGHLSRGETTEALLYYDAAVSRDPSNYLTFFKRATTYLSLGRTNQATDDFQTVLSLKPGFEGAHVQLAKIRIKVADWDGAREQYTMGGKGPDSPEVTELDEAYGAAKVGEGAYKNGDWESCVNQLSTAIALAARSASLRDMRAACRLEMGILEEAISDLQHVLHLRPGDISPYIKISAITFYTLGDLENGMAHIRKCLHSDPDSKPCKKLLRQEKAVGKTLAKVAKALDASKPMSAIKMLVDRPDETGLMTDVANEVKELRGEGYIPPKAPDTLYVQVVELVCRAYFDSNSKKAGQYCKQALELDENSFYGLLHQGKDFLDKEDFEAAIRSFEKADDIGGQQKNNIVHPLLNKAKVALKRSKTKDYYKVLGVANDADERQIKSSYRKLSKQYHPDKAVKLGVTKQEAEKKMAAINEAYEVLSDPELRARFDRGDDPNDPSGQSNPFHGSPFGGGGHPFFFQQGFGGGDGGGGGGAKFQFHFGGGGPF